MVALAATVVAFGVSSLIDWTWLIPGTAVPALFAGGWLAARGPVGERLSTTGSFRDRLRAQQVAVLRRAHAVAVTAGGVAKTPDVRHRLIDGGQQVDLAVVQRQGDLDRHVRGDDHDVRPNRRQHRRRAPTGKQAHGDGQEEAKLHRPMLRRTRRRGNRQRP